MTPAAGAHLLVGFLERWAPGAVVVNYRTHAAEAKQVVSATERRGGRAISECADAADHEGLVSKCYYGGLDVLMYNAFGFVAGPLAAATDGDYEPTWPT